MTKNGYSRRDFLKVLGATSGVAMAGCAQELPEKLIPYVVQPDEIIPGIASWYSGSCGECSAGCGWLVRTREGRAVKVEGNKHHPINRGGLCAVGQSSLQAHYDPDRVREPLRREPPKSFASAPWIEAVEGVANAIKNCPADKEIVLVTERLSGSSVTLVNELKNFSGKIRHIEWELLGRDTLDLAAEATFGEGVTTHFDFSKADVVVSFGAPFLETWISPVEFSRQWAERRRAHGDQPMSYFAHVEPRLSQTAGSADRWFKNAPGSEAILLAALLKLVMQKGAGKGLSDEERSSISGLVAPLTDEKSAIVKAGVSVEGFEELATRLVRAKSSLIVAGGASSSVFGVEASVLANILNSVLGNVGTSVLLRPTSRKAQDSVKELTELSSQINDGSKKVAAFIIAGTNPVFSLPPSSNFTKALAKCDLVVSISMNLDETAQYANIVLPLSSNLESWGDGEPAPGVRSLNQPSMQPLYKSQSLGDTLIAVGLKAGMNFGAVKSYYDYLRREWKKTLGESDFESRWVAVVERGGDWSQTQVPVKRPQLTKLNVDLAPVFADSPKSKKLVAFSTVNFFDGRGANRAWLQEIPNTMSGVVWGSWIEMNPRTAQSYGFSHGNVIEIRTAHGSVSAPVYISNHIHEDALAVPLGLGHTSYGRYGTGVGSNPIAALPPTAKAGGISFVAPILEQHGAYIVPSGEQLVNLIGSDSQEERRGIIRNVALSALSASAHHHAADVHVPSAFEDHAPKKEGHGEHGKSGHGEAKHHDPLALGPQPEPKQMYKQMDHPLYRWGMTIDLSSCTGCSACVVACYAENNIPIAGKELCSRGREMSWIRIERYLDGPAEQPVMGFLPMICQHCANAPCEPVCPVFATYHNEEGLNTMVYNRCVGTRYCSNNCSYKVRRFNWFHYKWPEPLTWQLNPDVTVREVGIMEKCTFCVQRIAEAKNNAKNDGRMVRDGEILTACASSCPTNAITFGNLRDKKSKVYENSQDGRAYKVLDQYINTQPAVSYLARVKNDKLEQA